MARVYTYAIISVTILIALHILGIEVGANSLSNFLNLITGEITFSDYWDTLFDLNTGILLASVGIGIIVGFIARAELENLIMIPFITGPLAMMVGTFIGLIKYGNANFPEWASSMLLFVLGGLIVGYLISLAEWFRGNT